MRIGQQISRSHLDGRLEISRSEETNVEVHQETVLSGDAVTRNAHKRTPSLNLMVLSGVERKAVGALWPVPCLVNRGTSDYADSYKNDGWHVYASATVAAYLCHCSSIPQRTE
jgi:nucleoside phosphorylase